MDFSFCCDKMPLEFELHKGDFTDDVRRKRSS